MAASTKLRLGFSPLKEKLWEITIIKQETASKCSQMESISILEKNNYNLPQWLSACRIHWPPWPKAASWSSQLDIIAWSAAKIGWESDHEGNLALGVIS